MSLLCSHSYLEHRLSPAAPAYASGRAGATALAKTVRKTAKALVEICQVLHGTGAGDWKGKTAEAFREKFDDDFRPRMDDARDSFNGAASALKDWADYMERKQKAAVHLESEAVDVKKRLGAAHEKADTLSKADSDVKGTDDHKDKATAASKAVNSHEHELHELRRKAHRLAKDYQTYGGEIASRLKTAMDIAPNEPGMWDKLGHAIEGLGEVLADLPGAVADVLADVGTWLQDHADWITVAASVIGVIAIFCPVLAPLAIGLSAVALFAHATKYGKDGLWPPFGDNASNWLTLGGDALGMVPGVGAVGKGIGAGAKAARGAEGLVAGTRVGLKTAGATAKGLMKAADPVAMVIDKPVMAAAAKLGVSRAAALSVTEGVQAAAMVAWTAPTAINAVSTSPGRADAATWGTGVADIATGAGGGKVGGVLAIGSAIGLGVWELTN
ncbi:putative T7SS-secreted protein [Streptomyces sp. NPDC051320]|uniref:WXG100 family type VII secretion target n=1 Tax=Streptomyces sp. NPDC051320 TaxID=3154644 RepID=UPI0034293957